jgi:hypothetical protein
MKVTVKLGAWAVAGALLAPAAAHAYVRSTTSTGVATAWASSSIAIEIYTADPAQFLTSTEVRQAVEGAAAAWTPPITACTDLRFTVTDVAEAFAPAEYDRHNRIGFRRGVTGDDWRKIPCVPSAKQSCNPYPPGAIAITTVTSNSNTGQILDADMEINAVNQRFGDLGPDGSLHPELLKVHDLQNTLTHELGHLLGFDHNCYDPAASPKGPPLDNLGQPAPRCGDMAPAEIRAATMYNQAFEREIVKRTLEPDDRAAVCDTYPIGYNNPFPREADDGGGCGMARGSRPAGVPALGLLVAGLFAVSVARRRR